MLQLEDAQRLVLSAIKTLPSETVPLELANGRFLAEPIFSPIDLPRFDNSAMDGYAVTTQDLSHASTDNRIPLRIQGRAAAGESFAEVLAPGSCVRVFTGSPLPRGADAVVMQEDVQIESDQAEMAFFKEPVKPWENVRFQGQDVKRGTKLSDGGVRLNAGLIGLLAATGQSQVSVGCRPVVGLVATGNELLEPGEPLVSGKIYESNRAALAVLTNAAGGHSRSFPLVRDSLEETQLSLQNALSECDVVLTSGGVSVGEMDFVKAAFQQLGGALNFWKVAVKPGKPFAFGQWRGRYLFGLPGNPVSAIVTFLLLVRPAVLRLQGAADVNPITHPGVLAERLSNPGDRRHFVRVTMDASGSVRSAGVQASHILSSLAQANGLVEIPPGSDLARGTVVRVLRLE